IDRDFSSSKPLEKLTTDITYLDYGPKRLYLSSIMDLFNGEILSYTISEKQDISAPIESFHSILKAETFSLHPELGSSTISVIETVQNFINYYNKERIQQKYDYLSPVEYRKKVIA
uniref:IS3 family transposase n=1 Tax=Vagococcus bubulae TaxID=1977868 RepID=UPI0022E76EF7